MRCMVNATPYRRIPKLVISRLVQVAVKWINFFPSNNGITKNLRPAFNI